MCTRSCVNSVTFFLGTSCYFSICRALRKPQWSTISFRGPLIPLTHSWNTRRTFQRAPSSTSGERWSLSEVSVGWRCTKKTWRLPSWTLLERRSTSTPCYHDTAGSERPCGRSGSLQDVYVDQNSKCLRIRLILRIKDTYLRFFPWLKQVAHLHTNVKWILEY